MDASRHQDFLVASKLREIEGQGKTSPYCHHLPPRIVIEATSRCNLNCLFCARSDPEMFSHGAGDLPAELLEKILEPLKGIKTIGIGGLGEPLLHPEIDKIVLLAKQAAERVTLTTNGTLLGEKAELLADLPLDAILVSIDGGMRIHEKIRHYPLDKLLESVKVFAGHSSIPLVAYAVLSNLNHRSLLKLPKLLADKKIPHLAAINYQLYNPLVSQAGLQYSFDTSLLPVWSRKMEEEAKRFGFSVSNTSRLVYEQSRVCLSPFLMPAINHNGFLTPCCRWYSRELAYCGKSGFLKAWNSEKIRSFRSRVLRGDYPRVCSRICKVVSLHCPIFPDCD